MIFRYLITKVIHQKKLQKRGKRVNYLVLPVELVGNAVVVGTI